MVDDSPLQPLLTLLQKYDETQIRAIYMTDKRFLRRCRNYLEDRINNRSKRRYHVKMYDLILKIDTAKRKTVSGNDAYFYELRPHRAWNESYELNSLNRFLSELRYDDIVWDIGAGMGLYTCLGGTTVTKGTGKIVAFEPAPFRHFMLNTHIETNNTPSNSDKKVLSNYELDESNYLSKLDTSGWGFETVYGDDLIETGYEIPDIVKIDVDGDELQVLKGMSEILSRAKCRSIFCEIHPEGIFNSHGSEFEQVGLIPEKIDELHNHLSEKGYQVDVLAELDSYGNKKLIHAFK